MNTLAIDTATTSLGLCLESDPRTPPGKEASQGPKRATSSGSPQGESRSLILQVGLKHSERLMPAVRTLLQEAGLAPQQLDLIVCSTGPGSFTGIRIGLATAKGLADGIATVGGRPHRLIGLSTLDGLAYRYRRFPGLVVAVNPSLRKKYHAAVYRAGELEGDYLETTLSDLSSALMTQRPLLITAAAAVELYELMLRQGADAGPELVVDASGQSTDPVGLLACGLARPETADGEPVPLYLRKSEAEITRFGE